MKHIFLVLFLFSYQAIAEIKSLQTKLDYQKTESNRLYPLAEQGDPEAQVELGYRYFSGDKGLSEDEKKGLYWYEKAAEQGYAEAQFRLGNKYWQWRSTGIPRDYKKALYWLKKAAEQGYAEAQLKLGNIYLRLEGFGTVFLRGLEEVPQDHEKALYWLKKVSELGNSQMGNFWGSVAEKRLGYVYWKGAKGVPQDHKKAVYWLEKAANRGRGIVVSALIDLGNIYFFGEGERIPQDHKKAFYWYEKAAEQGDSYAQDVLKIMNHILLAKQNKKVDPKSLMKLGNMYRYGMLTGVAQDYKKALYWYKKAAEQSHSKSLIKIGFMYRRGEGVLQDSKKAILWFKKAADLGDSQAPEKIGDIYNQGIGVPQDHKKALYWYKKAADLGNSYAQDKTKAIGHNSKVIIKLDIKKDLVQGKTKIFYLPQLAFWFLLLAFFLIVGSLVWGFIKLFKLFYKKKVP